MRQVWCGDVRQQRRRNGGSGRSFLCKTWDSWLNPVGARESAEKMVKRPILHDYHNHVLNSRSLRCRSWTGRGGDGRICHTSAPNCQGQKQRAEKKQGCSFQGELHLSEALSRLFPLQLALFTVFYQTRRGRYLIPEAGT